MGGPDLCVKVVWCGARGGGREERKEDVASCPQRYDEARQPNNYLGAMLAFQEIEQQTKTLQYYPSKLYGKFWHCLCKLRWSSVGKGNSLCKIRGGKVT